MGNCLVTKLKGSVNDESLRRLGEMKLHVDSVSNSVIFSLNLDADVTIRIVGNGYFVSNDNTNLGKTIATKNYDNKDIKANGSNFDVFISNKDTIKGIYLTNVVFDLSELAYCTSLTVFVDWNTPSILTGDISIFKNLKNLINIHIEGSKQITGQLSDIAGMTNLTTLSLPSPNITGQLSDIAGMTNLTTLSLPSPNITGQLSDIAGLTNLTTLYLSSPNITGQLSDMDKFPNLTNCIQMGININIGDFAKLPDRINFFSGGNGTTWSSRTSPAHVICTHNSYGGTVVTGQTIDKILQDLSNCVFDKTNLLNWQSVLIFNVNRTSASDAAVSKLQGMGITVTVPKAQ